MASSDKYDNKEIGIRDNSQSSTNRPIRTGYLDPK